ncbi:MAG: 50S ribosomal protein L13 [Fervidicoccaceae archaeon]
MQAKEEEVFIDASGLILGRMASTIAKMLLQGKKVTVVNAEKAVLSGDMKRVVEGYRNLWKVRTFRNPEKQGMRRPRTPSGIVKRTVKGMLPNKPRGKEAYKNLKVYIGIPKELEGRNFLRLEEADSSKLKSKRITVGELARALGWGVKA